MDLDFKKPLIEHSNELKQIPQKNLFRGCEFSVSNMILWADYYQMEYTCKDGIYLFKQTMENGSICLSYPIGGETEEMEHHLFELELEYFTEIGQEPCFGLIDSSMFERINRWYPERFNIQYERNWADYIYSREKLAVLAGKKLHGKRNHIKRFMERYPEWCYEPLSKDNMDDCVTMAENWCQINCCKEDDEKEEESHLVVRALHNFEQLNMKGGLLRTRDGVIAFTLGSPITLDTFDVSFEKAYGEIQGAYAMINQQFVIHELQNYKYVNREEDIGIEGLRKAKLSYYPEILLEKGLVTERI